MTEGPGEKRDEEDADRQEEEQRRSDLRDLADDSPGRAKAGPDLIDVLNPLLDRFARGDLLLDADRMSQGDIMPSPPRYADATRNDGVQALTSSADALNKAIDPLDRRKTRESFVAAELGYVADAGSEQNSDNLLSLVAKAIAGTPVTPLDSKLALRVGRLCDGWRAGEPQMFGRLADRYEGETASGGDLAEHIAYLSIVRSMPVSDAEKKWQWQSQDEVVSLVEQLIGGASPGDEIVLGEFYQRARDLTRADGTPLPTAQAAEVARLALAAVAGEKPERAAPGSLKNAGLALTEANRILNLKLPSKDPSTGQAIAARPDARVEVWKAAEYDLGEAWSYLYARRRDQLGNAPDGTNRGHALDGAVGDALTGALSAFSAACRKGSGQLDTAVTVLKAMATAETGLAALIGNLSDPANLKQHATEADVLRLLSQARGRVAEMCTAASAGSPVTAGRFGVTVALAEAALTTRSVPEGAPATRRIAPILDGELTEQRVNAEDWAKSLSGSVATWSDAVKARQPQAVADATGAVISAAHAARAWIDKLPPARAQAAEALEGALDEALTNIARFLNSAMTAQDKSFSTAEFSALRDAVLAARTQLEEQPNPAAAWKNGSTKLIPRQNQAAFPDLATSLSNWAKRTAAPVDEDKLQAASLQALAMLSNCRNAEKAISDRNIQAQLDKLLDSLTWTIAARLLKIS